jgi:hypothetical protein
MTANPVHRSLSRRLLPWPFLAASIALALAVGCSDAESDGAAAAQCHKMVSRLCDKLAPCDGRTKPDCVDSMNQTYANAYGQSCDGADAVGSTYDQCMIDIEDHVCDDGQPASCRTAIVFDR